MFSCTGDIAAAPTASTSDSAALAQPQPPHPSDAAPAAPLAKAAAAFPAAPEVSPRLTSPLLVSATFVEWSLKLQVGGLRRGPRKPSSLVVSGITETKKDIHTSAIATRHDDCLFTTKSGTLYRLQGGINAAQCIAAGLSRSFCDAFANGLPSDWQERVQREAELRIEAQASCDKGVSTTTTAQAPVPGAAASSKGTRDSKQQAKLVEVGTMTEPQEHNDASDAHISDAAVAVPPAEPARGAATVPFSALELCASGMPTAQQLMDWKTLRFEHVTTCLSKVDNIYEGKPTAKMRRDFARPKAKYASPLDLRASVMIHLGDLLRSKDIGIALEEVASATRDVAGLCEQYVADSSRHHRRAYINLCAAMQREAQMALAEREALDEADTVADAKRPKMQEDEANGEEGGAENEAEDDVPAIAAETTTREKRKRNSVPGANKRPKISHDAARAASAATGLDRSVFSPSNKANRAGPSKRMRSVSNEDDDASEMARPGPSSSSKKKRAKRTAVESDGDADFEATLDVTPFTVPSTSRPQRERKQAKTLATFLADTYSSKPRGKKC